MPDANVAVIDNCVELVKPTAEALVIAPVSYFINSTIGILTKLVPVILNVCDVSGAIV